MRKKIKMKLESNIWKFAVYLITNKRVFAAILGAYYVSVPNVGAHEVGIILLAGSIAGFALEIPSGYVSDKMGHKRAIVFSRICATLSTLFFLFADSLPFLILGGVFVSISHAFATGTSSAFLHETLRGLKREKEFAAVMGKAKSIGFAVPLILSMTVPFLVEFSFKLPFIVGLVVDIIGLITVMSFVVPLVTPEEIEEINTTNFIGVLREAKRLKFLRYVLFTGMLAGLAGIAGRYRAVYWDFLHVPVIYYGLFIGIGRLIVSGLVLYTGKLKEILSYHTYLGVRALAFFVCIGSLFFIVEPWIVVVIMVIMNIMTFAFGPLGQSYKLDIIGNSKFKATLLSLSPQVDVLVLGIGAYLFGMSIDVVGFQMSYALLTGVLLIILAPIYLYILKKK